MIASRELNDTSHPRLRRYLPCFRNAPDPEPETGDWSAWAHLLATSLQEAGADPRDAMNIVTDHGYGTVSSSLIALPAPDIEGTRPIWLFSAGRPGTDPFLPVGAVDSVP